MTTPVRRVVTGHNTQGEAVITADGPPDFVQRIGADGPIFHEVWRTSETPALISAAAAARGEGELALLPPARGTCLRIVDIPPEAAGLERMDAHAARAHFEAMGAPQAATKGVRDVAHPLMHRTETIDYGIVLQGELTLLVDIGETIVRAGDIVIQRGTNHAWANRSGVNCRVAFVLIDGVFEAPLQTS